MKSHLINKLRLHRPFDLNILSNRAIDDKFFYGLVSLQACFVFGRHITSLTRMLKFHFKRKRKKKRGSFFINLFLCNLLTKKPIGVRMGKGKGAPSEKVLFLRPGSLVLFLNDNNKQRACYVLNKCKRRFPVNCRIIRCHSW